jgi:hypothetical protein
MFKGRQSGNETSFRDCATMKILVVWSCTYNSNVHHRTLYRTNSRKPKHTIPSVITFKTTHRPSLLQAFATLLCWNAGWFYVCDPRSTGESQMLIAGT